MEKKTANIQMSFKKATHAILCSCFAPSMCAKKMKKNKCKTFVHD